MPMPKREDYGHETENRLTHIYTREAKPRWLKTLPNQPKAQKLCGRCREWFPLTRQWWDVRARARNKHREQRPEWDYQCIACRRSTQRARQRRWYANLSEERKEERRARRRERYQRNPGPEREQQARYRKLRGGAPNSG